MEWFQTPIDMSCGYCGVRVKAGTPIARLTTANLVRCTSCAGAEPDYAQIESQKIAGRKGRDLSADFQRLTRGSQIFDPKLAQTGEQ